MPLRIKTSASLAQNLPSRSLLSPATCCLVNPDREKTVERAFVMIRELSRRLREKPTA